MYRNVFGPNGKVSPSGDTFHFGSESVSMLSLWVRKRFNALFLVTLLTTLLSVGSILAEIEELPDIYFFPKDKSTQNGYEITNKNWMKLSDFKKAMFIIEALKEIEIMENRKIGRRDVWKLQIALNMIVEDMEKTHPGLETPVIRILYEQLV